MAIQIDKLPNGKYKVRVWGKKDIFGIRRSAQKSNISGITAAEKWGQLTEDKLNEGAEYLSRDISFKELDIRYIEERKTKVSPTTIHTTYGSQRKKILEFMKDIKAKNVSTNIVQKFIDEEQAKGMKKKTAKNYVAYIKAVINWGVAHDYLEFNRISRINYKEDDDIFEPTPLTLEQTAQVLAKLKVNCYNVYIPTLISILTSARRGEALGLLWDNIDFDKNVIYFRNNMISVGGKPIEKTKMKTKTSRRAVPMCDFLKEELLRHKEKYALPNDNHVCSNVFIGQVTPDYLTHMLHDYIYQVLKIEVREHDMRHTFSQIFEEESELLKLKSEMMGHSDILITRQVYTQPNFIRQMHYMNIIATELKAKMCAYMCA